jgi:hypothetical protein
MGGLVKMNNAVRTLPIVLIALVTAVAPNGSLYAQDSESRVRFLLPLDVSQGAILGRGEPTPYTLSARLSPLLGLGPGATVRIGATGAVTYANPEWEVAGGGRIEVRVLRIGLEEAGIFLGAEALRGTGDRTPISIFGLLDLAGVLRTGIVVGRDVCRDETLLEASVGADLVTVLYILFPSAAE